jgi:spore germination cell wall hydrolase CwlJ-like protein
MEDLKMNHWITALAGGLVVWALIGLTNSIVSNDNTQRSYVIEIPQIEDTTLEIDVDEMHCLAKNIYFEARGESNRGKVAVANVTMNRVDSPHYPNSICGVVYQAKHSTWWLEHHNRLVPVRYQCQFSWYCDGKADTLYLTNANGEVIKANMQSWLDSLRIAEDSIRGEVKKVIPTNALWYHADFVNPYWSSSYVPVMTVGRHIFYSAS